MARRKAPRVAPEGIPPGLPLQKNQEPYTPAIVEWIVFLIHSVIQYPAKVMKTIRPITLAEEQLLPVLDEQAGLVLAPPVVLPLWLGSYLTYTATSVTENQAPKASAAIPPRALTRKTCPKFLATSIVVCSITTLNGIRGIQLMKQMMVNMLNRAKTMAAE